MITPTGWEPRNTVVTLSLTTRPSTAAGDPRRYWEVLDWVSGRPIKVGGWGHAEFPYIRVRAQGGGPWAYAPVRALHTEEK